jgi:membrane protein
VRRVRGRVSGPTQLPRSAWWAALKRTFAQFQADKMVDWAAALTYYSIMSIFPSVIVLTALVGLIGTSVTEPLLQSMQELTPGQAKETLIDTVREVEGAGSVAGPVAIIGLLFALWAASAYVAAFIRAANVIYGIEEGRPAWKTLPLRVVLTLLMVLLLGASAIGIVVTGGVAEWFGELLGIGDVGLTVWGVLKWPVIVVLISLAFALLYWAAPNVRHPGFRWLTPGSVLAVLLWLLVSVGFGIYVANFGTYNKTYGSLAGVVVFLIWLWLSNLAVLLGAEFDAELAREQRLEAGEPAHGAPFHEPRDRQAMPSP